MAINRRAFLKNSIAAYAAWEATAAGAPQRTSQALSKAGYKRIATEEAWGPAEMFEMWKKLLDRNPADEPGFVALWRGLNTSMKGMVERLREIGDKRIQDMDAAGIDKQILSLTSPGVQVFDPATATALAASSNDQLAEVIRKYPDRYAGLAAVAPHDPRNAAKEIERGMKKLGLKGVIINSHTKGEYLDDRKFWDIFEAAESSNAPIYIHPREPAPAMLRPFVERDLQRGDLGFSVEVAFHTLAIINSGAFDKFPGLKLVIGHGGEGIPYWLYRLDYVHRVRRADLRSKNKPSYYMKNNIYVTTSGSNWGPAIMFAQQVLGVDRVLYAMDYPYQYDLEEVNALDALPITYEDKKKLYQINAERVFSL